MERKKPTLTKEISYAQFYLTLCCFLLFKFLYAQEEEVPLPANYPPSPEVSALAKFADVPISKYSGLPNTSLPLYEIVQDEFSLPISLSYHHGGIRVEERAGWVGLGWALQAGGSISRTIKGIPDEASGASSGFLNHFMDYENLTPQQQLDYYLRTTQGILDAEQDVFYFSFGSHSGKFVINKDKRILFLQRTNLKVEFDINSSRITGWRVWDEWGNKYVFNEVERSLQEQLSGARSNLLFPISNSAWHLSEISTYKGRKIHFTYSSYSEEIYRRASQTASYNELGPAFTGPCLTEGNTTHWVKTTTFGKQISIIQFGEGEVRFLGQEDRLDSPTRRLSRVQVVNKQGKTIRDFRLEHDYYSSNLHANSMQLPALVSSNTPLRRLRLVKLIELNAEMPYTFDYSDNRLPHLFSFAQDHWGFYNGQSNTSLIPRFSRYTKGNANRLSFPVFASIGHLRKINFPTGGSVTFEMEGNTALVSKSEYARFLAPLHQGAEEESYHAWINESTSTSTFRVEPQIFEYDTIKPFEVLVNVSSLDSFEGGDRDKVGTLELALFNQQPGHYVSLTSGTFNNGQLRGQVYLKAGEQYTLKMSGRQMDTRGVSAMVKGFRNPPLLDVGGTEKIEVNVGGLRVKQVIKDFVPKTETINYVYNLGNTGSSGVLAAFPTYDIYRFNRTVDALPMDMGKIISGCVKLELISQSNIPLGSNGAYFGYARVREVQRSGQQQLRTDFNFYSALEFPDVIRYSYPSGVVFSNEYRRGLPKSEVYWARVGQGFKKSRELIHSYAYEQISGNSNYVLGCGSFGPHGCIQFLHVKYQHGSIWNPEVRREERTFDLNQGSYLQRITETQYDKIYLLPTQTREHTSDLGFLTSSTYYPFNLPSSEYKPGEKEAVDRLIQQHRLALQMHTKTSKNNVLREETRVVMEVSGELVMPKWIEWGRAEGKRVVRNQVISYDPYLNIAEEKPRAGPRVFYGYERNGNYLNVVALNARKSEIAYTSFETADKGGWEYSGQPQTSALAKTGKYCYNLSRGTISKTSISASTQHKYKLTFFARRASGTGTWQFMGKTETLTTQWKLIEREVSSTSISIHGSGILVDELRLHPENAFLRTYTYEPLVGMLSHTDDRNYTSYYEYDAAGRLRAVRNDEGYLLDHFDYAFALNP
ncbi:hypothetical protein [Pleomorphovibrio marinus]|uniref:hypothetical protein n=1 Tax=Pleomorphovibrio marinus TaxID=2164132 RepID=UPI000E0B7375|nr:hypothetical protein [Pleomorphovibrio marinus]